MTLNLLILGVIIASNNFAAALALGAIGAIGRPWRILLVSGVFEFIVPMAGLWLGRKASATIVEFAAWIGPVLLASLGCGALWKASDTTFGDGSDVGTITSWKGLATLAAGLSVGNLLIGFSFGLGEIEPLTLATTIAAASIMFA